LYRYETWFLALREEQRFRVSENRVLRRKFRRKREEVVGGWRRLHNDYFRNFYVSPDIIRVMDCRRMTGQVAHTSDMRIHEKF
jgi:hypothetical protein